MCAAEACHLGPTACQALKADCSHWPLIPVSFVINLNLQKSLLIDALNKEKKRTHRRGIGQVQTEKILCVAHMAHMGLRTRRFSGPTFRDFPTLSRARLFFLLRISLFWSSFFFTSLLCLFPSLLFICPCCWKFDFQTSFGYFFLSLYFHEYTLSLTHARRHAHTHTHIRTCPHVQVHSCEESGLLPLVHTGDTCMYTCGGRLRTRTHTHIQVYLAKIEIYVSLWLQALKHLWAVKRGTPV